MNTALLEKWIAKNEPQGATKLAAGAEISPAALRKIRLGLTESPGVEVAKRLARVLGVSMDVLCGNDHKQKPPAA